MRFVLLDGGGTPTYKGVVDYFQQQGVKFTRKEAGALGKVILQNVVVPIMSQVYGDDAWLGNNDLFEMDLPEAEVPAAPEAQPPVEPSLFDLASAEAERNPDNPCCRYFNNAGGNQSNAAAAAVAALLSSN